MRSSIVIAMVLGATVAQADTLLGVSVSYPDTDPSNVPPGLANLALDDNGFRHFAVTDEAPSLPDAKNTIRFLALHLARDPNNPWRLLDLGLVEVQAAAFGDQPRADAVAMAATARRHVERGLELIGDDSPSYLFVAADALLEVDWVVTHQSEHATSGTREAIALFTRACVANRARPRFHFDRAIKDLAHRLVFVGKVYGALDTLTDCGVEP